MRNLGFVWVGKFYLFGVLCILEKLSNRCFEKYQSCPFEVCLYVLLGLLWYTNNMNIIGMHAHYCIGEHGYYQGAWTVLDWRTWTTLRNITTLMNMNTTGMPEYYCIDERCLVSFFGKNVLNGCVVREDRCWRAYKIWLELVECKNLLQMAKTKINLFAMDTKNHP